VDQTHVQQHVVVPLMATLKLKSRTPFENETKRGTRLSTARALGGKVLWSPLQLVPGRKTVVRGVDLEAK
jgi:hypothetical protein